jgi:hypothetical protein
MTLRGNQLFYGRRIEIEYPGRVQAENIALGLLR